VSDDMAAAAEQPARKQQQRSIITQQKLLDAAIQAFSENGFKGTSTRDIAERAGVHHPLITYHFKNKDQLWRAATDQVFMEFGRLLATSLGESSNRDAKTRFTAMIRAFVQHAHTQPAIHQIIVQESSYPNPRMDWLVERHLQPFFEATVDHIKELQKIGVAPEGNPAMLYHMIRLSAGGMLAIGNMLRGTSNIDVNSAETRDEIVEMIVRVYLPGAVSNAA
jgi:TetR/AcrR family transcriptional regulator